MLEDSRLEQPLTLYVRDATYRFSAAGIVSARTDAELITCHVLGMSRAQLGKELVYGTTLYAALAYKHTGSINDALEQLDAAVARRATRVPLQHITGLAPFRHIELLVGSGVFIPRPETELIVDHVAVALSEYSEPRIADLCAGSAAIGICLALEIPTSHVWAVEYDEKSYEWTRRNIDHYKQQIAHNGSDITAICADATTGLAGMEGSFHAVASNPPYIPAHCVPRDVEVRDFDPQMALFGGGEDGFVIPTAITRRAGQLLVPGGYFIMEHGENQGALAQDTLKKHGFIDVETLPDLTGRQRFTAGYKNAHEHTRGPRSGQQL